LWNVCKLMPNPDMNLIRKLNSWSLSSIGAKVLNTTPASWITRGIKMIMHQGQVELTQRSRTGSTLVINAAHFINNVIHNNRFKQ
jgi:hypothetical protein